MLASGLWLMLLMADCSTAAQDCPSGQMCTAAGTPNKCPARGQCEPFPTPAEIDLSLPVQKGERVYCVNDDFRRPRLRVNNACAPAERFGLSLASPVSEAPHIVVASADGVVSLWGGCASGSLTDPAGAPSCNGGYGNYVRLQHGPDLYTQYLHLSAILVNAGQVVRRGQPLGIEGNTGGPGAKHIHWSLHRGNALQGGPAIPMSRIRFQGGWGSYADLKCGDWLHSSAPDPATAYVSDNEPVVPPELARFRFAPSNPDAKSPQAIFQRVFRSQTGGNAELAELRALPDAGVNRYWLGAALQELKKNAEAERVLRQQQGRSFYDPTYQQWIALRLAELSAARGSTAEARTLLEKCRAATIDPYFNERWELVWKQIGADSK
ncbi:MAG TPA: M23 family metallopeptidase [Polyangia bacterium]|nr:M23 family metallopeptidase [Polyangia bacterium]